MSSHNVKVMTYMLDMSGSIQRTKEFTMQQVGETGRLFHVQRTMGAERNKKLIQIKRIHRSAEAVK